MGKREYVVYEEVAVWPWWAALLVFGLSVAGVVAGLLGVLRAPGAPPPGALAGGALTAVGSLLFGGALWAGLGRLRVVVTRTSLRLSYGYTGLLEKLVGFHEIEAVEAVRYSPLADFGGWGIRRGSSGTSAWTIRGDGAVALDLTDGRRLLVGSDRPRRLAERIRTAMALARRGTSKGGGTEGVGER